MLGSRLSLTCVAAVGVACGGGGKPAADTTPASPATQPSTTPPATTPAPSSANQSDTAKPATATPRAVAARGDTVTPLLETGCGGGVTGGGGGTFLTASGHVYRFSRGGPAPNAQRELTLLRRDSAGAAALVKAAEDAGITRIKYSEPSNMTCYLSLERDGKSYEVAWPLGTSPAPIRKLVEISKRF